MEGEVASTKPGSTATSLKRKTRAEESSEMEQSEQGEQGSKRAQSKGTRDTSEPQQSRGDPDQEMETKQVGSGALSPLEEPMEVSQQADSSQSRSHKQEKGEATSQDDGDTSKGGESFEEGPASSVTEPKRGRERGDGEEGEESDENSRDDGWEDAEEEEEQETLERWVKCVHALEWEHHVECEIRLAHHKHLRNLKEATTTTEGITITNRFEILKKEKKINEFYVAQYGWKAQHRNNDIQVQNEGYSKQFEWPKTYQPKGMKRSERKKKAQQETQQADKQGQSQASTEEEMGDEELMEDVRRQAAILEAQINVLKDQNPELDEDTMNLEKIAYTPHKENEAAERLHAKNSPRRRVILPFRWNEDHKEWEVAIHRSLALVTLEEANFSGQSLKVTILEDLPTHAYVIGDWKHQREDNADTASAIQTADYMPIMFRLQETAKLSEGLIWMPWQVVETILYGLLGGLVAVEWVARSAAIVVKADTFSWKSEFIEKRIARGATRLDLLESGS
ncbi:hypothetical protein CBR_g61494 [Chara braunii]|uniref:Uncharacterized protein n=1 Tax=Chara braunii TaxID=69332 RepID=A0A388K8U5_CHABU|nr:hypothetical protein CBR_g61494 [Chara braunii]|eukprot:GBG66451.1 hypothetical protein CBR_g61494 [Chara braunii]